MAAAGSDGEELDVLVVGAGVVGAGTALDAVSRGLSTALVEQRDFASGTSSRSSKLVHGGLRYLEMFDFGLVREALEERGLLLDPDRAAPGSAGGVPLPAAPHVGAAVRRRRAGAVRRHGDGRQVRDGRAASTSTCSAASSRGWRPTCSTDELTGAVRYYDCQVDDARLVMDIARTAAAYGAHVASRTKVIGFLRRAIAWSARG